MGQFDLTYNLTFAGKIRCSRKLFDSFKMIIKSITA